MDVEPTQGATEETCLQPAVTIARRQQAQALALRAVMGLSRLWQRQDTQAEARQLLGTVYDWFPEGFDTPDIQEGRALLVALS
jgi:predicted ATPase